jgi:hypothetical protein
MQRIDSVNCYAEFIEKSTTIIDYFHTLVKTDSYWLPYLGWDLKKIPREIFLKEHLLDMINKQFLIKTAVIMRTDPYQNYRWHIDRYRGVCINMLLTPDVRSYCMFGTQKNEDNVYFSELNYEKNSFYLFNNQMMHSVINFNQHRYLFSIEFVDDKSKLSYDTVYKWCSDVGLLK